MPSPAMTTNRKWLLLPPAVALLLVLGPLSMRGEPAAAARVGATPVATPTPTTANPTPAEPERSTPALPRTPDGWQLASTLVGVLLLGAVGLMVARRLQKGPSSTGSGAIALRQTLRLSPKQSVHALEFDGRLLLVGEGERGLVLLHANTPPSAVDDEATVAATSAQLRAALAAAADDDGAVPKNLVLPRPTRQPVGPAPSPRAVPAPTAPRGPLHDFRALLAKAGR